MNSTLDYNRLKKQGWQISFRHVRRYVTYPPGQMKMDQSKRMSHFGGFTTCMLMVPGGLIEEGPRLAVGIHQCPDTARFNKKQNNKKAFYKALRNSGYLDIIKHGNHL